VKLPNHGSSIAEEAGRNIADFHLLACSGAQTVDLTQASVEPGNNDNTLWRFPNNYHWGEVNQIDESGWLDEDTSLVTVSIGGNDIGFGDVLSACVFGCGGSGYVLTRNIGDLGQAHDVKDPQPMEQYQPYIIDQLQHHLVKVYEQIHIKAPSAQIVVVGYPHLFRDGSVLSCQNITTDRQTWMNTMADRLSGVISGAVATAKVDYPGLDIALADPTAAYRGHSVCEVGAVQWIRGVEGTQSFSFHPNPNGHIGYAEVVNGVLVNH
jgi:hypothetical protein